MQNLENNLSNSFYKLSGILYITEDVMYTGQATWFSPDGSYLAFASFDDREVETYSYYYYVDMTDPDDQYSELVHLKYPKVCMYIC